MTRFLLLLIFIALSLISCGSQNSEKITEPIYSYLEPKDGTIVMNRQIEASNLTENEVLIGFTPVQFDSYWLSVNQKSSIIKLMLGSQEIMNSTILSSLNNDISKNNQHQVLFKDHDSLWYANDQYYLDRNLAIPEAYSADRFLKGAYGDKTIFLNSGWSIYSTKLNGLNMEQSIIVDQAFLNAVFEVLTVDSLIEFS